MPSFAETVDQITADELRARGKALGKTAYGRYLIEIAEGEHA